jgi:catechol 2,3-dioxygenase-like lactoylglutathione lyase family enzyme
MLLPRAEAHGGAMKPNHVHFHVRNVSRSKAFYKSWFGLKDGRDLGDLVFLTDGAGFDLALSYDADPLPLPPWFHFGFRARSADEVRELDERMRHAGVPMRRSIFDSEDRVALFCHDPDGHPLEVYWE